MNYQISFPRKWFQSLILLMFSLLVLFQLNLNQNSFIYCQSCGPRISARQLKEIPCDLSTVSYCTEPGSAYPWSSVRRYIFENQGFVKKMYGEQRQSQIIREELRRINEQYQDIDSESVLSLRNARKKNFRHFHDHHEENDINNNSHNDGGNIVSDSDHHQNNETTDNTTMTFHYLDEVMNDNNNNEPFAINDHHPNANHNHNNHDDSISISLTDLFLDSSTIINTQSTLESEFTTINEAVDQSIDSSSDGEEQQSQSEEDLVKGYNACPITQEVVAPYWANNTRGETLALLNVYPFEQYIHWEKCSFEGEQMFCRDGCKCEQQFRLHRLLAFDPKNECRGIFADWFRFPGCCVCICYDNHERINNRKARL